MERISAFGQVKVYLGKCFRLFKTEKRWKNFLSTLIIMVIISMVTGEDMFYDYGATRNGAFAIVCACIWIGLFNSIQSICREREIIKREHRTGLRISSYIAAHAIYELAVCAVEAVIVTGAVFVKNAGHMIEEGVVWQVPMLYLIFLLATYSSDAIAILISSIVKSENSAMTVMPFVLIIQLVMSGTVFELSGLTLAISNFTISKWGLNGICAIANVSDAVKFGYTWSGDTGCDPTWGNVLLIMGVLLLFTAVYLILSVIALGRVDQDQR